ncbi:hypothetical protein CDV31_005871 [Fusarium ambrosium]|uniref:Uncharacterized protein n=1 Tax=Fusarium ambrosium TaxID=131363 RepID=A0A428UGM4_9HYPO|nr:hypothetical protein CDV31_005871 [Fusarium ambrosium]
MDLEDSRHRSISQTSLHSSYQAHERLSDISRLRPPSQLRRPYQSLNETSALLRSPGPLESMLKTTTETGDIGIFSIKPPTPSIGHRHPRRPRPERHNIRDHFALWLTGTSISFSIFVALFRGWLSIPLLDNVQFETNAVLQIFRYFSESTKHKWPPTPSLPISISNSPEKAWGSACFSRNVR